MKTIEKRLEELEKEKFMLDMKDRWNHEDINRGWELTYEIKRLKKELTKQVSFFFYCRQNKCSLRPGGFEHPFDPPFLGDSL